MGISLSFPIVKEPPCFLIADDFKATGEMCSKAAPPEDRGSKFVGGAITEFMKDVLDEREAIAQAREKFLETDYSYLKKRFPFWSVDDIVDLKAQFQSFDRNYDGLIDFEEMCIGLDEIGDQSSPEERRETFIEIDVDKSGAVDFEEYLCVLAKTFEKSKGDAVIYRKDLTNPSNVNKLDVVEQIDHGLF